MTIDAGLLATMFAVAAIAGAFDAIAGGGGLLTVPALLLTGMSPVAALGTNKLQGAVSAISSTSAFARRGLIDWKNALPVAGCAAVAGLAGALCASVLSPRFLAALVPILLIVIALYFGFSRGIKGEDASPRLTVPLFAFCVAPVVGFYDGIFGPGAGAFYMVAFVTLLGYGALKATAHTKLANAASNLGSLSLFILKGAVVWPVGLAMAVGAFLGAQIGSRLAMRFGARLIRPLLVVMSCAMAVKLLSDPANPLRQAVMGLF
ncbi:MAG: TSUP family transporter [Caulobacter sp.]|nr:TSUP family transporter [Caulobacter sp.]